MRLKLALVSVCLGLTMAQARAEDKRELAVLPAAAQEVFRQEMIDNLAALNELLSLLGEGKLKEAGSVAETKLGISAMGKNRSLPLEARPGAHMPKSMHAIGVAGHRAASEFATLAANGDKEPAWAKLPEITRTCVACHVQYRVR